MFKELDQKGIAMELFQQALSIYQRRDHYDARRTANALKNIGIIYSQHDDYPKAIDYFIRALGIERHEFGPDNPNIANTFSNMGVASGRIGDHKQAINLYQIALDINKRLCVPGNVDLANLHHNIAMARLAQGEGHLIDAMKHFKKSHRLFVLAFSKEHVKAQRARELLYSVAMRAANEMKGRNKKRNKRRLRRILRR